MIKKIGIFTALLVATFPCMAKAELIGLPQVSPLKLFNNTAMYSAIGLQSVNLCSGSLGDYGIGDPGQTKDIPEGMLYFYCQGTPDSCVAQVYLSADKNSLKTCSGIPVGTVVYSINRGAVAADGRAKVVSPNLVEID